MANLMVFTNGIETYVANSIKDCLLIFKEMVGDDYVADGYGESRDWHQESGDDYHTIFFEDREAKDFPRDGTFEILEEHPEGRHIRVKAQNRDWILWNGRGFLSSTEF